MPDLVIPKIELMTAQQLLDGRNNALTNMRNVMTKYQGEGREATPAEIDQMKTHQREAEAYMERMKNRKESDRVEGWLKEEEKRNDELMHDGRRSTPSLPSNNPNRQNSLNQMEQMIRWNPLERHDPTARFTGYNERMFLPDRSLRGSPEYSLGCQKYIYGHKLTDSFAETAFAEQQHIYRSATPASIKRTLPKEKAYLQSDDDIRGGYLNVSETFMEGLLKAVDDATWIWRLASQIIVATSESLGIRKLTQHMSTWEKGGELSDATLAEDDSIRFGKKALTPHYYVGSARLSRDLMRLATLNPEQLLYAEFARDLSYLIEQEAINGNGVQGILGCMVPHEDGIDTDRDYSMDTTTTTFKFETFIGAKYAMKPQYRQRARWMFNRSHIAKIAKIRTDSGAGAGTGSFIWQPSMVANMPDMMLGLPVDENEFFPTATGASVYFGMLAVWEFYKFAIGLDMEILRLNEVLAHLNQIRYIGRVKLDGMPILSEAFLRLQFAAA